MVEIPWLTRGASSSGGLAAELAPLRDDAEKVCVSKHGCSTVGIDLKTFLRCLEGAQPLCMVITGLFGRVMVTDSIIGERPFRVLIGKLRLPINCRK